MEVEVEVDDGVVGEVEVGRFGAGLEGNRVGDDGLEPVKDGPIEGRRCDGVVWENDGFLDELFTVSKVDG